MMHTEKIDLLAIALHQFQNELENISRDTKAYNYKYATLASCLDYLRPILFKHNLSVCQVGDYDSEGNQYLVTYLIHTSGQYITSRFLYKKYGQSSENGSGDVQMKDLGLRISYIRRYALCAILGLTQADDEDKLDLPAPAKKQKAPFQSKESFIHEKITPFVKAESVSAPTLKENELKYKKQIKSMCEEHNIDTQDFVKHFNLSTMPILDLANFVDNFSMYKDIYFYEKPQDL